MLTLHKAGRLMGAQGTNNKIKAQIGDIVIAEGYGGLARVITIDDHVSGLYQIASIQFGPYNLTKGDKLHDFPLGRLTVHKHANGSKPANNNQQSNIDQMSQAQILIRLAELNAELQGAQA
jgi:hypothetical protein